MFEFAESSIAGCFQVTPKLVHDSRGRFVKIFHKKHFLDRGLHAEFEEEYYSHSSRGVIRGLHFQNPPHDHVKIVYCVAGEVFDVVLDLRIGSPTYGKTATFNLSAEKGNYVYIPKGLAHGFCALEDETTVIYKVGTMYSPNHDAGIRWDSLDIPWPNENPIISKRDLQFPPFESFNSPF